MIGNMDNHRYSPRISQALQQEWVVSGAFKNRQHAAWPALFRKAHTDLEGLGGIICPAEWRPRHSVAEFLNKGAGHQSRLLLVATRRPSFKPQKEIPRNKI
ncbi:MAG: hypothetical protein ACRCXR_00360, partial [Weissella cibaria]